MDKTIPPLSEKVIYSSNKQNQITIDADTLKKLAEMINKEGEKKGLTDNQPTKGYTKKELEKRNNLSRHQFFQGMNYIILGTMFFGVICVLWLFGNYVYFLTQDKITLYDFMRSHGNSIFTCCFTCVVVDFCKKVYSKLS